MREDHKSAPQDVEEPQKLKGCLPSPSSSVQDGLCLASCPVLYQPLNLLISTPRKKREELNGIPSPRHPRRPPPPLPLLTPHRSFSELLGSHAGLQAGAKGKFWGWGRGHEDACPGNARLQGKGAGNPRAPNAGVRAGAEPLRTSTATSTTCPRCGLGTLRGQRWEIPAGVPSRPLLEQHLGVGTPRLDPKPSAATGQHGVSATSSCRHQDGQTDGQNSHEHDPKSILAPASREPPPRSPARCELHQLGAASQEGELGNETSSSTSEPPRWMSSPARARMMRGNLLKATGFQRIPLAGAKPTSRAILARPRRPSGSRRGPPGTAGHGATRPWAGKLCL